MKSQTEPTKKRRVMAGSIGDCVHSLGVETFAEWMEDRGEGHMAVKLGPAVPIQNVINKIREARPEVVAISMRLGDLHVDKLISEFIIKAAEHNLLPRDSGIRYAFGGLRPAANLVRAMTGQPVLEDKFSPPEDRHFDLEEIAENYADIEAFQGFFALVVDDFVTMEELEAFAEGTVAVLAEQEIEWAETLLERVHQVRELENRPIIRAHIGVAADSIEPTVEAVEMLSDAGCLEIVSLAPDQPAQEYLAKFVRGEEDPEHYLKGQGGVPIRSREDLRRLKEATRRGNYPMTRIYSGTDELVELAKLFEESFRMPFPAVPIFFYNELDGRGPISIRDSFDEHFEVMRWWAERRKAVEINDPHQWQLRNATDDLLVTDHVIAGVVALKMGIKQYVMQMMFDLPPGTSGLNDLAKFQAAYELIEPLQRHFDVTIIKETRGGLSSFPPNLDRAKGHLTLSTHWQMYMEPDIVHVVSFSEAHHEATAEDVIESCDIVKQVFDHFRGDHPSAWDDPRLIDRKKTLKLGAMYNLLHLALLGGYDGPVTLDNLFLWMVPPEEARERSRHTWDRNFETLLLSLIDEDNYPTGQCGLISPDTLDLALQVGLLQAPHITVLDKRYEIVGKCRTKIVDGGCVIDEFDGVKVRDEIERVDLVRQRSPWFFDKTISQADEDLYITETAEAMDEDVLARARRELDIHSAADLESRKVLVVDFGSTFSKIGTFDTAAEEFSLRYVPTIVEDLRVSLADGLQVMEACDREESWEPLAEAMAQFDIKLPCSSAKGGLKMVTVSMVKEESGFAAELAALTAGAKLLNNYQGKLTEEQALAIYQQDEPEIILQAGGVDFGGDTETQLHNARLLAKGSRAATYARYGVPVIYAGNQDVRDEIERIYKAEGVDIRITPNVMPEINTYRIEVVNEAIRELFQTIIIRGKGFDVVEEYMSAPFMPTPRAAFRGINLLAKGYGDEAGLGNIMALDIGGATTDFYSNVGDNPLYDYLGDDPRRKVKRTILKTPNTPLAYRRVEGKYGLAYDAENVKELERFQNGSMQQDLEAYLLGEYPDIRPGDDSFGGFMQRHLGGGRLAFDLDRYLSWLTANPHQLPTSEEENAVRSYLAKEIMAATTGRNLGHVKETDTYFLQYGVNFLNQPCITLLIGGAIYHKCQEPGNFDRDLRMIAAGTQYNEMESWILRPRGGVLLDAAYMVSIVGGLYGRIDPERALRMMKRTLVAL